MNTRAAPVLILAACALATMTSPCAADTEAAKVTAAAIRAEGLPCAEPVTAQRDAASSKPDQPVWMVACGNAQYRVRFRGDTRPQVERLQ